MFLEATVVRQPTEKESTFETFSLFNADPAAFLAAIETLYPDWKTITVIIKKIPLIPID